MKLSFENGPDHTWIHAERMSAPRGRGVGLQPVKILRPDSRRVTGTASWQGYRRFPYKPPHSPPIPEPPGLSFSEHLLSGARSRLTAAQPAGQAKGPDARDLQV